jgi:hypothetical protein
LKPSLQNVFSSGDAAQEIEKKKKKVLLPVGVCQSVAQTVTPNKNWALRIQLCCQKSWHLNNKFEIWRSEFSS